MAKIISNDRFPNSIRRMSGQLTPREARKAIASVAVAQERASTVQKDYLRACAYGRIDRLRDLLEDPSLDVNAATLHGAMSALHYAASRGHLEVVRLLLEAGADATIENNKQQTPLDLALEARHVTIAQVLLSWPGQNITLKNEVRNLYKQKVIRTTASGTIVSCSDDTILDHSMSLDNGELKENINKDRRFADANRKLHPVCTVGVSMATSERGTRPVHAALETLTLKQYTSATSEDESGTSIDSLRTTRQTSLRKQNSLVKMRLFLGGPESELLAVSVMTPREVGPWYDKYVEYLVEIAHPSIGKKLKVYRRFSDFLNLHAVMEKRIRETFIAVQSNDEQFVTLHSLKPQKHAFRSRNDAEVLQERMRTFENLLHFGINNSQLNPVIIDFILEEKLFKSTSTSLLTSPLTRRRSYSYKRKASPSGIKSDSDTAVSTSESTSNNVSVTTPAKEFGRKLGLYKSRSFIGLTSAGMGIGAIGGVGMGMGAGVGEREYVRERIGGGGNSTSGKGATWGVGSTSPTCSRSTLTRRQSSSPKLTMYGSGSQLDQTGSTSTHAYTSTSTQANTLTSIPSSTHIFQAPSSIRQRSPATLNRRLTSTHTNTHTLHPVSHTNVGNNGNVDYGAQSPKRYFRTVSPVMGQTTNIGRTGVDSDSHIDLLTTFEPAKSPSPSPILPSLAIVNRSKTMTQVQRTKA
eukprot:CFRG4162T1